MLCIRCGGLKLSPGVFVSSTTPICGCEAAFEAATKAQRGPSACPNCGWEDGWAGTPPCMMPWGGRAEDHATTYRDCKYHNI